MESIQMQIEYAGAPVLVSIFPEDHFLGTLYPVDLDGQYAFTIHNTEEDEWSVLREPNGNTPEIDPDMWRAILKNLHVQLKYAA